MKGVLKMRKHIIEHAEKTIRINERLATKVKAVADRVNRAKTVLGKIDDISDEKIAELEKQAEKNPNGRSVDEALMILIEKL